MTTPLILLFSRRQRIRDVLSVGLVQSEYQVIQADVSYLGIIKAYQFLPDLIVADITPEHTRDVFLIPRLKKSVRTAHIPILVIVPGKIREALTCLLGVHKDLLSSDGVDTIEYPFSFAELQKRVRHLVFQRPTEERTPVENIDGTESLRKKIEHDLVDLQVPTDSKLRAIEHTLQKQWAFPFTVIRALDIIESSASCFGELGKCISTDPGATAAILRVANTVHYARRGKPVTDITEAVVRLGFRETRNLLACLALIDLSPDLERRYGFSRQDFWLHSLSTGVIAEKLCAEAEHRRPELAFIAGLVHDLGKIPIDNNFNQVFSRLLDETASQVSPYCDTEERILGFTHAHLGHFLANKWNFPTVIGNAILFHHSAQRASSASAPIDRLVHESVFVGNILAKAMTMGHSCDEYIDEIPQQILNELHIPRGPSERFFTDVAHSLGHLCQDLSVPTRSLTSGRPRTDGEPAEVAVVLGRNTTFHPIVLALRNNGYDVKVMPQFSPEANRSVNVVVSVSEKGCPLDIMLYEDEKQVSPPSPFLKVFLLDSLPDKGVMQNFEGGEMVFMSRKHLDFRLLMHTIDNYLGRIVAPERLDFGAAA